MQEDDKSWGPVLFTAA